MFKTWTFKPLLLSILGAAAIAYGSVTAYLYVRQDEMVFPRHRSDIEFNGPRILKREETHEQWLQVAKGATLHGVWFEAHEKSAPLTIVFPGNAHDALSFAEFIYDTLEGRQHVVGYNYRGYGKSSGQPSQKNILKDAQTIQKHWQQKLKPGATNIVGYSIGTGVATHLSLQTNPSHTFLIAPIYSIKRMAQDEYPWLPVKPLLKHPFPHHHWLAQLTNPVTIIHASKDELIPENHKQDLNEKAPKTSFIKQLPTTHGDILYHNKLPTLINKRL